MDINLFIILLICIICIIFAGKVFSMPLIKKILKLVVNSILGGVLIYIINIIGEEFNLHIGLNIGTSIFVGIFGIPGAIMLIIFRVLFTL